MRSFVKIPRKPGNKCGGTYRLVRAAVFRVYSVQVPEALFTCFRARISRFP